MLLSAAVSGGFRVDSSAFAAAAAFAAVDAPPVVPVLGSADAPVSAVACEAERPWGSPRQQRLLPKGPAASSGSGAPKQRRTSSLNSCSTAAGADTEPRLVPVLVRLRRRALLS